jgi:outer membrane biogenesis lipoprotein LolB
VKTAPDVCFLLGGALVLFLFLQGCAAPRPILERTLPEEFPFHSAEDVRRHLQVPGDTLRSFRARGSLVYRTPDEGGTTSVELRERRGDSLYVSVSPALGIEAARALVTPDSFYFYDRIQNRLTYGSIESARHVLPDPFGSEEVFENLLGLIVPSGDVPWSVEAGTAHYTLRDPSRTIAYHVDPALWRVVRYERFDASGTLVDQRIFSEFDKFDGVVLPRRVTFRRPTEERTASIYYRTLSLNPSRLSFDLQVRDSAERILAVR